MRTSALQKERVSHQPKLSEALQGAVKIREETPTESADDQDEIRELFPHTYGMPLVEFVPSDKCGHKLMNVGIIPSGDQALGEHNIISGLFDAAKKLNEGNHLYGFSTGPGGLVDHNYIEITAGFLERYRNTGGFDMIGSGHTELKKEDQFEKGLEVIHELGIKALVITGGDNPNISACVLAEYYAAGQYGVQVIGCPKAIDGDLKSEQIETPFGFDTATRAYLELIGSIGRDRSSTRKYWHFIRLMGRSASHIALEYVLQTQPNVCLTSKEIQAKDKMPNEIAGDIVSVVAYRAKEGGNFGVVLIPEDLIEFIPTVSRLTAELNDLLVAHGADYKGLDKDARREYILTHLSDANHSTFETLPEDMARQLSLDRNPHGSVQVSLIETGKLLSDIVSAKLNKWEKQDEYQGKFSPLHHFLGYKGHCVAPSNFDADYCYVLGISAAQLIANGKTGYMAIVKNTTDCADNWKAGDVPITMMMNMERRTGEMKPVIHKVLVESEGKSFETFAANRDGWADHTCYVYPEPIQYWGPSEVCDQTTRTLALEQE